jgi:hypothetical protein
MLTEAIRVGTLRSSMPHRLVTNGLSNFYSNMEVVLTLFLGMASNWWRLRKLGTNEFSDYYLREI